MFPGLAVVGEGIWKRGHFFIHSWLWAVTLQEIDALSGSVAGVTVTIVVYLIMGWLMWYQACWCQMGLAFPKGEDSLCS